MAPKTWYIRKLMSVSSLDKIIVLKGQSNLFSFILLKMLSKQISNELF